MSNGLLSAELQDAELLQCAVCRSTLHDAVLLTCLHSVCRSCVCDSTASVTCPVCNFVTHTSATIANLVVSTLVHQSQVMKSMFSCTHCAAESNSDVLSVAWCYTCQQSLCVDCEKHHKRYNSNHPIKQLDESTVLSELYRLPSRMCTQHGDELKLVCFTCRDGLCCNCGHNCYMASHDVQPIDSQAAVERLQDRITDAARVMSDLSSIEQLLQAHISLPVKVAASQEESRGILRNAKKKAIDSISTAYDRAEHSLVQCWEALASKAQTLCESASSLKTRLEWANKYCQVALHTKDVTSLLPQLELLRSCLCSLLDEARKIKQPADPLKLIDMNVRLPHDLDLITSDWIGTATLISDNFECSVDDTSNEVKNDYYARRVLALSELEALLSKHEEQQEMFELDRLAAEQQLDATKNEVKKLLDKQNEQQEQLDRARRTVEQLQAEVKSITPQLEMCIHSPLQFHATCGKNIFLEASGRRATRTTGFDEGLCFSSRPVCLYERLCLRILSVSEGWAGSLRVGFCVHDPSTINIKELPDISLCSRRGYWATWVPSQFITVNNMISFYVNATGDILLMGNNTNFEVILSGVDVNGKLWAFIDIYANCTGVEWTC